VKVLIVAELLSFYITAVIKMNTVEVVLFLVPDGYVSIILATGQIPPWRDGDGFDKTSGSEVLFQVQTSIYIFSSRVLSPEARAFSGDLLPGVGVRV
jgi:hypothetical protein